MPARPSLTEATFYILLCLAGGPRHGYAILKEVQLLSDGRLALSTGTLYGALRRLLDQGWIERAAEADPPHTGHERKAYRLTGQGRRALRAEADRLGKLARAARVRLAARQP